MKDSGIDTVLTPYRAPNCNAFAERFVRSIKEECLGRMIMFGENSLHGSIAEYVAYYHGERPHQGLGNELIDVGNRGSAQAGRVHCRERLGGLLRCYRRAA